MKKVKFLVLLTILAGFGFSASAKEKFKNEPGIKRLEDDLLLIDPNINTNNNVGKNVDEIVEDTKKKEQEKLEATVKSMTEEKKRRENEKKEKEEKEMKEKEKKINNKKEPKDENSKIIEQKINNDKNNMMIKKSSERDNGICLSLVLTEPSINKSKYVIGVYTEYLARAINMAYNEKFKNSTSEIIKYSGNNKEGNVYNIKISLNNNYTEKITSFLDEIFTENDITQIKQKLKDILDRTKDKIDIKNMSNLIDSLINKIDKEIECQNRKKTIITNGNTEFFNIFNDSNLESKFFENDFDSFDDFFNVGSLKESFKKMVAEMFDDSSINFPFGEKDNSTKKEIEKKHKIEAIEEYKRLLEKDKKELEDIKNNNINNQDIKNYLIDQICSIGKGKYSHDCKSEFTSIFNMIP